MTARVTRESRGGRKRPRPGRSEGGERRSGPARRQKMGSAVTARRAFAVLLLLLLPAMVCVCAPPRNHCHLQLLLSRQTAQTSSSSCDLCSRSSALAPQLSLSIPSSPFSRAPCRPLHAARPPPTLHRDLARFLIPHSSRPRSHPPAVLPLRSNESPTVSKAVRSWLPRSTLAAAAVV